MVDVTSGGKADPAQLADGDRVFLTCPCRAPGDDPAGFYPMLARDGEDMRLAFLVCRSCEHRVYFDGGVLAHNKPVGPLN